jgi:hypothetical protein
MLVHPAGDVAAAYRPRVVQLDVEAARREASTSVISMPSKRVVGRIARTSDPHLPGLSAIGRNRPRSAGAQPRAFARAARFNDKMSGEYLAQVSHVDAA